MALDEDKPAGDDLVSSLDTYGQEVRVAVNLNTVHKSSDGSDHTFLDQSVISGAAPTFLGTNITAIPDAGLSSGATVTSAGAADSGKLVKLDASGILDSTVIGASFEITDLAVTGLTVSQLLRVNAGGTAVESSGKTVPTGDIVGTSDTQTLAAKTLTLPQINDTSSDHQYVFAVNELSADRTVTLPLLTTNDTFVFAAFSQTLTNKILTSPQINGGVLNAPQIDDTTGDHQYLIGVSELGADRTITLPLLVGNDDFTLNAFAQTLTNKTLTTPIITDLTNMPHDHTDGPNGGTLTSTILTTPKIDDGDTHVTITSTNQTHAAPTVTIPDIVDAADTFAMVDTAQTLTNKTIGAGVYTSAQAFANAATPGGAYTDGFYMYSSDIVAGNAAPHFFCEDGNIIMLYQVSSADQADQGVMTTIGANTGTSAVGLSLIGATNAGDVSGALMNDLAALNEDIIALDVIVTALTAALINHGLIKGSA